MKKAPPFIAQPSKTFKNDALRIYGNERMFFRWGD